METLTKAYVARNGEHKDHWHVEQFNDDGACLMAIFVGPDAQARAHEYADIRNEIGKR